MKSFTEYSTNNEDFKPKNLPGRKEAFKKIIDKKSEELINYYKPKIESYKFTQQRFLENIFECALDAKMKNLGELVTTGHNPTNKTFDFYFFDKDTKDEIVVRIDYSDIKINMGSAIPSDSSDNIFVPILDIK